MRPVNAAAAGGRQPGPPAPRPDPAAAPPAPSSPARYRLRLDPAKAPAARTLVLIGAVLLLCIGTLIAFRTLAPLGLRREVAELISPGLRPVPEVEHRDPEPQRTNPVAIADGPVARASVAPPLIAGTADDKVLVFSDLLRPVPPAGEMSPLEDAKGLFDPPGGVTAQIDPGAPPRTVEPPAEPRLSADAANHRRATPPRPLDRLTPLRPETEQSPGDSMRVAALFPEPETPAPVATGHDVPPQRGYRLLPPPGVTGSLARHGGTGVGPGASPARPVMALLEPVGGLSHLHSGRAAYPLDDSLPADTPPTVAARARDASPDVASAPPSERAGPARKTSPISSRRPAVAAEAQVLRGSLERELTSMLKTRLRELRRP